MNLIKNKILLVVALLFLACSMGKTRVFADYDIGGGGTTEIDLFSYLRLRDNSEVRNVYGKPSDMVNLVVKVLFVGAGLVLFFMIIVAGFSMIKGGSKDKDKAKTTMTSAVIGFIVMFAAYWIMQILQLLTGTNLGF